MKEEIKYSMLTPVEFSGRGSNRAIQWLFKCDCGNQIIRNLSAVRTGKTTNCGCASNRKGNGNNLTKDKYIEQAKKTHNSFYNYDNLIYTKMSDILIFDCPVHGKFSQRGSNHLQGRGCRDCGKEGGSYKKEEYIKKSKGKDSKIYLIKCWNSEEEFYKIGITIKEIKKRFRGCLMPYNYNIVYEYTSNAGFIWDLEVEHHRKYKDFKYKPKLSFAGQTECFSSELPIEEIVNNLNNG